MPTSPPATSTPTAAQAAQTVQTAQTTQSATEAPSVLDCSQISATAKSIVASQTAEGMILWFEGGHADVWNHTEAAMALAVAGICADKSGADKSGTAASEPNEFIAAAERAYEWIARSQLPNGSWHNYYLTNGIEDPKIDTNCCAYPAVGVLHHYLITADRGFLEQMWPVVDAALSFVVGLAREDHHIPWAVHEDGTRWSFSLLTGSCSILMSLEAGLQLAKLVGCERPGWELAAGRLRTLIANQPDSFEPKHRWAMDWYYPVLCGAVEGEVARAHLAQRAGLFVERARGAGESGAEAGAELVGVRCVNDKPWITAAETCECAMAYLRAGDAASARALLRTTDALRSEDGSYFTGVVLPKGKTFPANERTSYTAAAVLLAADALDRLTPAAGLLSGEFQLDLRS